MGSTMQEVSKIVFVAFWVFSFTRVKSQAKPSGCAPFFLTNGFTLKSDRGYLYTCDSDYKAFDGKWWGEVTCQGGQWSDTPLCIPDKQCGQIPTVFQVINQGNQAFEDSEWHEFECEVGPCCFHCVNGKWQNQDCASDKQCGQIPTVFKVINQGNQVFDDRERHEFECELGPCCFHCVNGRWQKQDCTYQKCPTPPYVENAVITSHEAGTSQQSVTYECHENYSITGQQKINCIDSKWEKAPTCTF
ncbi:complement factor H-like isoform X2 [Silurus meridionalis]|uniref:complement factor H-like isoform X2 n=1 Tax=Silurus meridionalis TaxID=175797 RepID=UPI001EEB471B|nr:complement factor H-like isoform X2 [Silurus meridionalis]